MMDSIPLAKGYYSDNGYRLRQNNFEASDSYIPFSETIKKKFYDYQLYN